MQSPQWHQPVVITALWWEYGSQMGCDDKEKNENEKLKFIIVCGRHHLDQAISQTGLKLCVVYAKVYTSDVKGEFFSKSEILPCRF